MKKLSEVLQTYKKKICFDLVESYYLEKDIEVKIGHIKELIEILGDVEFEDNAIKIFLYEMSEMRFSRSYTPYIDIQRQIKEIYDLIKDSVLSSNLISTLFRHYEVGVYELYIDDIKYYIDLYKNSEKELFVQKMKEVVLKATAIAEEDALKLEDFKEKYGQKFITEIQNIIINRFIPFEKVISILPSKDLIDSSNIKIPLGYTIISGEDLIKRRLYSCILDEEIEQTEMDDYIKLGMCSTGEYVYTSFTKKEYYDSLKEQESKKLIRK